ncbi:MAG: LLM class flavin-dependent oxidoreductase [Bacteroidales bacterium]|nr:LLM class flavin-dependent oxidoreductase [Bacteroidales bacterium]
MHNKIKFYVALQGIYTPRKYIKLAKYIEELSYDRIYVYDDLLYYPSIPILTLMAEHTKKIELGPCLLNGFYRHPAIIVSSILSINEIAKDRTVLGLGRGAFYDFLGMDSSEVNTRQAFEENVKFVKHLLDVKKEKFTGKYFNSNENACLRIKSANIPLIAGTWNEDMAYIAGLYCNEIQIADVWDIDYLNRLQNSYLIGNCETGLIDDPKFSIGGICCVSEDEIKCREKVVETLIVYLPYLTNILKRCNVNYSEKDIAKISELSKAGNIKKAAQYVTNEMIDTLTIWGTPEQVVEKINTILKSVKVDSIMFSVPFGVEDSVETNLKLIKEKVIPHI